MTDIHNTPDTSDEYVKDQLAFLRYAEHYHYLTPEHKELIDGYADVLTRWRDKALLEARVAREAALRTKAYEDGFIAGRVSEAKKCEAAKIHDMKAVRKAERTRVITEAIERLPKPPDPTIVSSGEVAGTIDECRAALQAMLNEGGHHE